MNTESISSNNNYTINNFYQTTYSGRTSLKRFHKNIQRNYCNSFKKFYFLPKMTLNNFKKMNNFLSPDNIKKDKVNLYLAPLLKTIGNNRDKSKGLEKEEKNNPSNGREIHNNNNIKILSKINASSFYKKDIKKELKKKKKFLTIKINKAFIESKNEENDMKPKIRFINIKKNLLEESLKINKMFDFFNKQINDQQKTMKFIGKQRNNKINKNNKNNTDLI